MEYLKPFRSVKAALAYCKGIAKHLPKKHFLTVETKKNTCYGTLHYAVCHMRMSQKSYAIVAVYREAFELGSVILDESEVV